MDTAAPRKGFDLVAYLKLFRFPLVFTAIADSATGCLLGKNYHNTLSPIPLLMVSSAGLYFFGMALNDIADRERDKQIAPGRVIPSGRITLRSAILAASISLAVSFCAILAITETPILQRVLLWGLVVASIVAYDKFIKLPPVMGLVRSFNLLLGVSAAVPLGYYVATIPWVFGVMALPAFVYVSALTYVSTLEDSEVDRVKVAMGAAFMILGVLLAAAGARVIADLTEFGPSGKGVLHGIASEVKDNWFGIPFGAILAAWIIRRAVAARDKKGIMLMIRDGVAGIIFLDAALLGSECGLVPALCVSALLIPAAVSVAIFKRLA